MAELTSNSGSSHKPGTRGGLAYRGQVTARLLAALAETLPIRVQRVSRYWISIDVRPDII